MQEKKERQKPYLSDARERKGKEIRSPEKKERQKPYLRDARERKGKEIRSPGVLQYKVLSRFRVNDAKPRTTPLINHFKLSKEQSPKTVEERKHMTLVPYASEVGSLMYAMIYIRPDIAHAVGVVSRYMTNQGKEHWEVVEWLLRYMSGKVTLQGFMDADLGENVDSSKSTSSGVCGNSLSWEIDDMAGRLSGGIGQEAGRED
uniref:Reverse transcriptase Ty1/copia-type domain-containing protein n=1 Tax=Solanum lycopersicum TaxID=4081 RepID=A0A3Q7EF69_SOLLC